MIKCVDVWANTFLWLQPQVYKNPLVSIAPNELMKATTLMILMLERGF